MTPTERSMPAVRITSVCAMPSVAMMVTCCRISDRLNGAKNLPPTMPLKKTTPRSEHQERDGGRIGVQEVLRAAKRGPAALPRSWRPLRRSRQHLLEVGGARPAASSRCSCPSAPDAA